MKRFISTEEELPNLTREKYGALIQKMHFWPVAITFESELACSPFFVFV